MTETKNKPVVEVRTRFLGKFDLFPWRIFGGFSLKGSESKCAAEVMNDGGDKRTVITVSASPAGIYEYQEEWALRGNDTHLALGWHQVENSGHNTSLERTGSRIQITSGRLFSLWAVRV